MDGSRTMGLPEPRRRLQCSGEVRISGAIIAAAAALAGCSGGGDDGPAGATGRSESPTQTASNDPNPVTPPGLTKEQRLALEAIAVSSARARRDASALANDPRAVAEVRECGTGIGGQLIITGEIRVGPLLLNFLASFGANRGKYEPVAGEKVIVTIQPGHHATVVIGERHRSHAALVYTSSPAPAVTFRGCEQAPGEQPPAMFNGGINVAGDRCLPLDVYVDDESEPRKVVASFGAGQCNAMKS